MDHAPFTSSMTRSIQLLRRSLTKTGNFVRKFGMNSMMRDVSPADKFLDPMDAFDLRAVTSTTMAAVCRKKPKAQKTLHFCIRSFTVTIKTAIGQAIPFSMGPANCWAARVQIGRAHV